MSYNQETSNVGTRWSIEEDEKLLQEINDNKSYEEIALEHKRSLKDIKSRLKYNNILINDNILINNNDNILNFLIKLDKLSK